jgi:hypothetical protein
MPSSRGEGMTGSRGFGPTPTHTHHYGDVAPQPHSHPRSSPSTPTEHALNLLAPVVKVVRPRCAAGAPPLTPGSVQRCPHRGRSSSKQQLKTSLTTPRPFRDDTERRQLNSGNAFPQVAVSVCGRVWACKACRSFTIAHNVWSQSGPEDVARPVQAEWHADLRSPQRRKFDSECHIWDT